MYIKICLKYSCRSQTYETCEEIFSRRQTSIQLSSINETPEHNPPGNFSESGKVSRRIEGPKGYLYIYINYNLPTPRERNNTINFFNNLLPSAGRVDGCIIFFWAIHEQQILTEKSGRVCQRSCLPKGHFSDDRCKLFRSYFQNVRKRLGGRIRVGVKFCMYRIRGVCERTKFLQLNMGI